MFPCSVKSLAVLVTTSIFLLALLLHHSARSQSLDSSSSQDHDLILEDATDNDFFPPTISKIIGGSDVNIPNKYPWFTLLMQQDVTTGEFHSHGCGATLVTKEFVLTAAHCVNARTPSHVRIGALTRQEGNGGQMLEMIKIHEAFIHPAFNEASSKQHDIALIKIATPATIAPLGMDTGGISKRYSTGTIKTFICCISLIKKFVFLISLLQYYCNLFTSKIDQKTLTTIGKNLQSYSFTVTICLSYYILRKTGLPYLC